MKYDVFKVKDSHDCKIPHIKGPQNCEVCGRLYRETSEAYKDQFDQWHHGFQDMQQFGADKTIDIDEAPPIFDMIGDFSDVNL